MISPSKQKKIFKIVGIIAAIGIILSLVLPFAVTGNS